MPIIKRYPNRKLYDTEAKRYVTLEEIAEMIQTGQDVQVTDHESGDDLTTLTLTQIILEQEKKSSGFLPRNLLTNLIRTGGDTVEQVVRSVQLGLIKSSQDDAGANDDRRPADSSAGPEVDAELGTNEEVGADKLASDSRDNAGKSSVERALDRADERFAEILHLINVPSRRDVEALQVQLAVLSQRLEEILEGHEQAERAAAQIEQVDQAGQAGNPEATNQRSANS